MFAILHKSNFVLHFFPYYILRLRLGGLVLYTTEKKAIKIIKSKKKYEELKTSIYVCK
jgi:hypothetical protein